MKQSPKGQTFLALSPNQTVFISNNSFPKGQNFLSLSNQPNRVVTIDHSLLKGTKKKYVALTHDVKTELLLLKQSPKRRSFFFTSQPKVVIINDSLSKGTKIIVPLPVIINDLLLKGTHFSLSSR